MEQESIQLVRYGEARHDKVNVIWWQTFSGSKHWISIDLEWYNKGRHPVDALRIYAPDFKVSAYTTFELLEPMYEVPSRGKCEGRYERFED